jgi:hypothetical protein
VLLSLALFSKIKSLFFFIGPKLFLNQLKPSKARAHTHSLALSQLKSCSSFFSFLSHLFSPRRDRAPHAWGRDDRFSRHLGMGWRAFLAATLTRGRPRPTRRKPVVGQPHVAAGARTWRVEVEDAPSGGGQSGGGASTKKGWMGKNRVSRRRRHQVEG